MRINAGIMVQIEIHVGGQDAVANDGLALGAAISQLQNEGWYLEKLEREPDSYSEPPDKIIAVLTRTWDVRAPRPIGQGETMEAGADEALERNE